MVNYDMVGEDAQPFEVGIYCSASARASESLVATLRVSKGAEPAPGRDYSLAIKATFADLEDDYVLVAKIEAGSNPRPSAGVDPSQPKDSRVFDGGVFVARDGTLHVHGTTGDDQVAVAVADNGGVRVRLNDTWYSYKPHEVSSVHIRTHAGDDVLATSALVHHFTSSSVGIGGFWALGKMTEMV